MDDPNNVPRAFFDLFIGYVGHWLYDQCERFRTWLTPRVLGWLHARRRSRDVTVQVPGWSLGTSMAVARASVTPPELPPGTAGTGVMGMQGVPFMRRLGHSYLNDPQWQHWLPELQRREKDGYFAMRARMQGLPPALL
jgi:hypothetical protein